MAEKKTQAAQTNSSEQQQANFAVARIYTKDLSFESPNSPDSFNFGDAKPHIQLDLQSKTKTLQQDMYEVVLSITVKVEVKEKYAYLVEVHQAGLFGIRNMPKDRLAPMLGIYCPNLLFPYAQQQIADLVMRGGFPQLMLAPVNFEALYAQHLKNKQQANSGEQDNSHEQGQQTSEKTTH